MYALGIDLGTTFTAAAVHRDGRAEICSLGTHAAVIPSVVLLRPDGTYLAGEAAARRSVVEPTRVAREFKRRFGDSTPLLLAGTPCTPQQLTAELLRAVMAQVSAAEGGPPSRVCISHPANWGPFKRQLLAEAVRLAGIDVPVQHVTEPVAAAQFYAREQRLAVGDTVAVYDLGGGTFDAAVLRRTADGFELLGQPEGIERLGGVDVDAAVYGHVMRVVSDRLPELDEDDPATVSAVARLREECTTAKEALSADTETEIPVILPGLSTQVRLIRSELEAMVRPALYDSIAAMQRAIRSAGLDTADVTAVLLVGGSSRMPLVAQLVGAELGRPVNVDAHPKHAVALGAAWAAVTEAKPPAASAPPGVASGAPATVAVPAPGPGARTAGRGDVPRARAGDAGVPHRAAPPPAAGVAPSAVPRVGVAPAPVPPVAASMPAAPPAGAVRAAAAPPGLPPTVPPNLSPAVPPAIPPTMSPPTMSPPTMSPPTVPPPAVRPGRAPLPQGRPDLRRRAAIAAAAVAAVALTVVLGVVGAKVLAGDRGQASAAGAPSPSSSTGAVPGGRATPTGGAGSPGGTATGADGADVGPAGDPGPRDPSGQADTPPLATGGPSATTATSTSPPATVMSASTSISSTSTTTTTTTTTSTTAAGTVTVIVDGSGSVSGDLPCGGGQCSAQRPEGTTLTLTAVPDSGYQFTAWSGCSSTSGTSCTLQVGAGSMTVRAAFEKTPPPVPGAISGLTLMPRGSGTVLSATWEAASGATGYRVVWTDDTGATLRSATVTSAADGLTLKAGTNSYTLTVTPVNAAGDGQTARKTWVRPTSNGLTTSPS